MKKIKFNSNNYFEDSFNSKFRAIRVLDNSNGIYNSSKNGVTKFNKDQRWNLLKECLEDINRTTEGWTENFVSFNKHWSGEVSCSYYFVNEQTKELVRISNHWSSSNYQRETNYLQHCYMIRSCYWHLKLNKKQVKDINKNKRKKAVAAITKFSHFETYNYDKLDNFRKEVLKK